jgi:peroxiredoxin (alkyl hydroperoxide reductase subunit C)
MSLIGENAPLFISTAVINGDQLIRDFSIGEYIGKRAVILFFFRREFSLAYPHEIFAFHKSYSEFLKRDISIFGVSSGSDQFEIAGTLFSDQGSIAGNLFPIIADPDNAISEKYGILNGNWDYNDHGDLVYLESSLPQKGIFLIDKKGIVRHEYINFFSLDRNIREIFNVVDALDLAT